MASLPPTKGNLIAVRRSRELAQLGYELMDKKRNILIRELMSLIDRAKELQGRIDSEFPDAYAKLKIASITQGGCEDVARSVPADDSVSLRYRSVMGVELPSVYADAVEDAERRELPYGLVGTSESLDAAYVKFQEIKKLIRELAETENAVFRLAYSIKKTQKRANALSNIVLPSLERDIVRISDELEEKDREEFVRLKVIKATKRES